MPTQVATPALPTKPPTPTKAVLRTTTKYAILETHTYFLLENLSLLMCSALNCNSKHWYAEVILPFKPKTFTYAIATAIGEAVVGHRVVVPFRGQLVVGVIVKVDQQPRDYSVKKIVQLPDKVPLWPSHHHAFLTWLADYYMVSLASIISMACRSISDLFNIYLDLAPPPPGLDSTKKRYTDQANALLDELQKEKQTWKQATRLMPPKELIGVIQALLSEKALTLVKPLMPIETAVCVALGGDHTLPKAQETATTAKQKAAISAYATLVHTAKQPWIPINLLQSYVSRSVINRLVDKGVFIKTKRLHKTTQYHHQPQTIGAMHDEVKHQASIQKLWQEKKTVLVAGTALTKAWLLRFFLQALPKKGSQALCLVPSLTKEMYNAVARFGNQAAVYDATLSKKEKHRIWYAVSQQKIRWVIGTKAALFLPFQHLVRVCIDEENNRAHYQPSVMPYFNARNSALMLAKKHQAHALLTAQVASLESYHNVCLGKYGYIAWQRPQLDKNALQLIFNREKVNAKPHLLCKPIRQKIAEALAVHTPTVLLVQYKGYASYHVCSGCGWVATCPDCQVSLTFYQSNRLVCHYCSYTRAPLLQCQSCNDAALKQGAVGIEQLAELLAVFFPEQRIITMNDQVASKSCKEKLRLWQEDSAAILVGLPHIIKALPDLPKTFIVIVDIDKWLRIPDFRAQEHCFQYLVQLTSKQPPASNEVWLQTSDYSRRVVRHLLTYLWRNDFATYYRALLEEREAYAYPPYTKILRVIVEHRNANLLSRMVATLTQQVEKCCGLTLYTAPFKSYSRGVSKVLWLKSTRKKMTFVRARVRDLVHRLVQQPIHKGTKVHFAFD